MSTLTVVLPRVRTRRRRRKPWRPVTWLILGCAIWALSCGGFYLSMVLVEHDWRIGWAAAACLAIFAVDWHVFQRLRREDERDD